MNHKHTNLIPIKLTNGEAEALSPEDALGLLINPGSEINR